MCAELNKNIDMTCFGAVWRYPGRSGLVRPQSRSNIVRPSGGLIQALSLIDTIYFNPNYFGACGPGYVI